MKAIPYPRFAASLAATAVLVFCIQIFSDNKADVDLWGNVGFVTAPAWSAAFPTVNTFSFTEPDHPWINHEWLGQYLLHLTYSAGGCVALLLLKIGMGLLIILLFTLKARRDGVLGPVFLLYLLLVISTLGYGFSTRPHLFTYVLYAFFLFVLTGPRDRTDVRLALLPILGLLWTNLHGAFFIGIILLLAVAVLDGLKSTLRQLSPGERRRTLAVAACAAGFILLSLVNPYGSRVWVFITESAARLRPYLSEWAPFHPLRHATDHVDFMVLALIALPAVIFVRQTRDLTAIGLLVLALAAALFMRRNIPLFAITAAFLAPPSLECAAGPSVRNLAERLGPAMCSVLLAVFILISAVFGLGRNKTYPLCIEVPHNRFPVEAVAFMRENRLSGNLLTFFDWSEYAVWKLYPDCHVFLDGRFLSAYSGDTIDGYFDFLYGKASWTGALDDYETDILLLHRENPAAQLMNVRHDWTLVYADALTALFLRNDRHEADIERLLSRPAPLPEAAPAVSCFP